MSARAVTDALKQKIEEGGYGFYLVNYANPDMVGHTGNLKAAVEAVEFVMFAWEKSQTPCSRPAAMCSSLPIMAMWKKMFDANGQAHTAHTTNDVPCILVSEENKDCLLRHYGSLQDVAPTVLDLLRIEKPAEMTGVSLIEKKQ